MEYLITKGRLLALDLGAKRVGVAVSDEFRITARPVTTLARTNWKTLLAAVRELCLRFDASGVVIGLPLSLDNSCNDATHDARRIARNLQLSLNKPVFLQDEKLSSVVAEQELHAEGFETHQIKALIDARAASIILRDFMFNSNAKSSPCATAPTDAVT